MLDRELIVDFALIFAIVFPFWLWQLVLMPLAIDDGDAPWWKLYGTVSDRISRNLLRFLTIASLVFSTLTISFVVLRI